MKSTLAVSDVCFCYLEETKMETPPEEPGSEDPAPVKAASGGKRKKSSLCILL